MKKTFYWLSLLLLPAFPSLAQLDLQCGGRDMHSIYLATTMGKIYRIDSIDTNPSAPVLVVPYTQNCGGISISPNFDSTAGPLTMYHVKHAGTYHYWNGNGWSHTNHVCGGNAVNPGGSYSYMFGLDGGGNSLYRYDGTGDGTLLLADLDTWYASIYDVATDNQGNFYILYTTLQKCIAYDPNGTPIDSFTISNLYTTGGGFAIVGNRMYVTSTDKLYEGIKTGSNVHFTLIDTLPFFVNDIAACPGAGSPLSDFGDHATNAAGVYPNPVQEQLQVKSGTFDETDIIIHDLTSRNVIHLRFNSNTAIDMSHFSNGVYFYEIRNRENIVSKGLFVKN